LSEILSKGPIVCAGFLVESGGELKFDGDLREKSIDVVDGACRHSHDILQKLNPLSHFTALSTRAQRQEEERTLWGSSKRGGMGENCGG
jgi:hypothetical protein